MFTTMSPQKFREMPAHQSQCGNNIPKLINFCHFGYLNTHCQISVLLVQNVTAVKGPETVI